jgi:glucosyl-3-phosphoglycerate synthase
LRVLDALAEAGARAIGRRIDLAEPDSIPPDVLRWHAENSLLRYGKLLSQPDRAGKAEHWQFSGASLALTAEAYELVGGIRPLEDLEDEHLEEALRANGVPIERLLSVRATTSARLEGRASRGLARDLVRAAIGRPVQARVSPDAP